MNLEEMGVQEMNSKKLQETDGGIGLFGLGLLCGAAYLLGREVAKLLQAKD
jgi:hypothetical protein